MHRRLRMLLVYLFFFFCLLLLRIQINILSIRTGCISNLYVYAQSSQVALNVYSSNPSVNRTAQIIQSINWSGSLTPGRSVQYPVYVRNEGQLPFTQNLSSQNWQFQDANGTQIYGYETYFSLSWDDDGSSIAVNAVRLVNLNLAISSAINNVSTFSFDIIITATAVQTIPPPPPPNYTLTVLVTNQSQPVPGATVLVSGVSAVTGTDGKAVFAFPTGTYQVSVTYQGTEKNQTVALSNNQQVQFDLSTTPVNNKGLNYTMIIAVIIIVLITVATISAAIIGRRKT